MAKEGETAVRDGRTRWESVQKLQQIHVGRRPTRPNAVRKENGELTQGPMEVLQRWHQHFSKLLNQQSTFDEEAIQQMEAMPPWLELDEPPTEEELEAALSKLKKSKAGGNVWRCSSLEQVVGDNAGHVEEGGSSHRLEER